MTSTSTSNSNLNSNLNDITYPNLDIDPNFNRNPIPDCDSNIYGMTNPNIMVWFGYSTDLSPRDIINPNFNLNPKLNSNSELSPNILGTLFSWERRADYASAPCGLNAIVH